MPSALFFLIASHYVFNLSYHPKMYEVLRFVQEKIVNIPSDDRSKVSKSLVASSHINEITSVFESLDINSRYRICIRLVSDLLLVFEHDIIAHVYNDSVYVYRIFFDKKLCNESVAVHV